MIKIVVLDSHGPHWRADLDTLYQQLEGGQNPLLLPYHFLQAAFPHIGGRVVQIELEGTLIGVGFALPYASVPTDSDLAYVHPNPGEDAYVIRYHPLPNAPAFDRNELLVPLLEQLPSTQILLYDPAIPHTYQATHQSVGTVDIGRPGVEEATSIRELQQRIWGSPAEFLYPIDLYSSDFPLGTTLVARVEGAVAGFLFGFYKRGGPILPSDWATRWQGALRIESQVMGVLPTYRGLRIGYLLKKIQATQALVQGIGVIHWTVDPLQYPNAALNFGLLRAICFTFTPDYYPFRNELNRGPASRLSLTWLIGSPRVSDVPLFDARSTVINLTHQPEIVRVNQDWQTFDSTIDAPLIAIEIPANWTKLQQTDPDAARQWRATTDQLFGHYLGSHSGQYVITDVGVDDEQRFLIAQRVDNRLWARLEGI